MNPCSHIVHSCVVDEGITWNMAKDIYIYIYGNAYSFKMFTELSLPVYVYGILIMHDVV